MSSGVKVSDSCKHHYQCVKMNTGKQKKHRFAVFKIGDDLKQIIVDDERMESCECMEMSEPGHFADVIKNLPEKDGRYLVYDYPYQGSFGPTSKVIMVMWCPGSTPIKNKMLYASSKDALKKCFPDCTEFQADCLDDLNHDDIAGKLNKV